MKKEEHYLITFLKYHNAVPIIVSFLVLSGGATFAATNPAVQQSIYSASTQVRSVDNSFIVSTDLKSYPLTIRITNVAQDNEDFYLSYNLSTIDIVDNVWQNVTKPNVLKINKALLGKGSLSEYAESELAQVRDNELRRLTETQAYERKLGLSQKVVATAYAGLVGKFITPTTETLPVYTPPAAQQDATNPLAVQNPQPLTTWDANVAAALNPTSGSIPNNDPRQVPISNQPIPTTVTVTYASSTDSVGSTTPPGEPVTPEAPPAPEPASSPTPQDPAP